MKKIILICCMAVLVMAASCSKGGSDSKGDADSAKDKKTEQVAGFDSKKVADKIKNGQKLTDEEVTGAAEYAKKALQTVVNAQLSGEELDEAALDKQFPNMETIFNFLYYGDSNTYSDEVTNKVGEILKPVQTVFLAMFDQDGNEYPTSEPDSDDEYVVEESVYDYDYDY